MNQQAKLLRKITRDAEEYVKTKNQLRDTIKLHKMGNIALLQGSAKLFNPVTTAQDNTTATLNKILDKQEDLSNKIQALQYPQLLPIVHNAPTSIASEPPAQIEHDDTLKPPRIASQSIREAITEYASRPLENKRTKQSSSSTTMHEEGSLADGSPLYFLNGRMFVIHESQLEELDRNTEQTVSSTEISPNIAQVLFNPNPLDNEYTTEELGQYLKILRATGKEPTNSGGKMKSIFAQLTSHLGTTSKPRLDTLPAFATGEGVATVFLSSDPKLLVKRLMVLIGSKKAGNTANIRNEAVSIMDHLLQTGALSKDCYKKIYDEFWV